MTVKFSDDIADIFDIIISQRHIHRKHKHALEQPFRKGQRLRESQLPELVHRLAAPLEQGTNPILLQKGTEFIPLLGFDLIVLEYVEVSVA